MVFFFNLSISAVIREVEIVNKRQKIKCGSSWVQIRNLIWNDSLEWAV